MDNSRTVRIGTRGSDLALWQANHVKNQLEKLGHHVEINIISTKGDRIQDLSFDKLEGKGFFTKEIEEALLNRSVDLAVHSHKDLETTSPEGLMIGAVSSRENAAELLLIHPDAVDENSLWNLKNGAVVGTSSARRKSQLVARRSDVEIIDLRGNVPTRIQKLREKKYDAILLAKAGVNRLNLDLSDLKVVELEKEIFVPAPAQGVLGLQIRSEDSWLFDILSHLNDKDVAETIAIERGVLQKMNGGCQLPLGVYCTENEVHVAHSAIASEGAEYYVFPRNTENIVDHIVKTLKG